MEVKHWSWIEALVHWTVEQILSSFKKKSISPKGSTCLINYYIWGKCIFHLVNFGRKSNLSKLYKISMSSLEVGRVYSPICYYGDL